VVCALTPVVVTVKVAVLLPAATVTEGGTAAAGELLDSATGMPPAGAAESRVTVPVELAPPLTLVGLTFRVESVPAAVIVSEAFFVVPLNAPLMVAVAVAVTVRVVTGNVAEVWPAATVTEAGTVAFGLLLESATAIPPAGAAPLSFAVPVEEFPPTTDVGLSVTLESATFGVIVRAAVLVTPPYAAPMVADAVTLTTAVVTVKAAVV
jgi:hypothetical protein